VGGKGIIPTRDDDRFGLGYFYTNWSDTVLADALGVNSAQGIELFYNIQVTPWLQISPDLQVLIDPGGVSDRDTAIVYGLWAKVSF
jgi:porin